MAHGAPAGPGRLGPRSLAVLLLSLLMWGTAVSATAGGAKAPSRKPSSSGPQKEKIRQACAPVGPAPPFDNGTYYRLAYEAETAAELRKALAEITASGYQRYSYSCVWDMLSAADEDPSNPDNVLLFYTGQSWPKKTGHDLANSEEPAFTSLALISHLRSLANFWGAIRDTGGNEDGWNREHVWPKSHGFPGESQEPYTDGHHLTACEKWLNNRRSDKDFNDGGSAFCYLPLDNALSDCQVAGAATQSTFEVPLAYRGNAARMLFYLEVRYGDAYGLRLVDRTTESSIPEFGLLCTLLRWHEEDPVRLFRPPLLVSSAGMLWWFQPARADSADHDEHPTNAGRLEGCSKGCSKRYAPVFTDQTTQVDAVEQRRNNAIYAWQFNRNPFVDHPEWVAGLWSNQCSQN